MAIRFSVLLLGIVCLFGVQRAGAERAAPNDAQLHSAAGTLEKTTKAGWVQFDQREFMFFAAGKVWEEAQSTCMDYDAHLASVHSDREDAFIKRLIWNHVGSDRPSWLGGYNSHVVPSRWFWTDESAFDFNSWTPGQPDGSGHCLQTNFKGGWDDLVCERNLPFVCARGISRGAERAAPNDAQPHSAAGPLEKNTKAGWIQFDQREFMFFAAGKVWEEAQSTCMDYDANLASVHSDREDAFIKRLIWNHVGSDRPSWLGGYNSPVVPSRWYWTDGSVFDFNSWTQGQPDGSGHCLQTNFKGGWDDLVCERNLPFVCARGISRGAERAAPNDAQLHSAAGADAAVGGDLKLSAAAGTLEKNTKAGWIQFDQREFMFFAAGKVWEEAQSTCMDYDAHLASVHSDREDAFIKRLIWNHVGSDRPSWLGGYNSHVVPSRWYWTDASVFDFNSWTQGQPDGSGHCLQTNFKGGWDDLDCNQNLPFVCARGKRRGV
ncbi:C-type mannose receptor 2-like [Pygocentrus nattereri]|uniref:C-type mannose receptor 2-like n=1 Tax=Pygocentrus nattereri TaxID=42514 RepID=UPI001891F1B8|nr:C-type mannose receptor 2-like [Pygocentrus nattereri]